MRQLIKQRLYKIKKKYWAKAIILCYHRVGDYLSDPYGLTVSKKYFISQIQWLSTHCNLISLDDLSECLKKHDHPPKNAIILTFDDGYVSTSNTIEFLEERNIPATFFICTPNNANSHFYWDVLSHILIEQKEISDDDMDFILGLCKLANLNIIPEKRLDDDEYYKCLKWKFHDENYPTNRCRILRELSTQAEYEGLNSPNSIINVLNNNDFRISIDRSFNPKLDKLDLQYCDIGGHTMNHFTLSSLNVKEQEKEIINNKKELETKLGKKINHFAYPFGSRNHYDEHSINIVENNFSLALSNFPGRVHKESNRFELPRFLIRNWPLNEFKGKINSFFVYS